MTIDSFRRDAELVTLTNLAASCCRLRNSVSGKGLNARGKREEHAGVYIYIEPITSGLVENHPLHCMVVLTVANAAEVSS